MFLKRSVGPAAFHLLLLAAQLSSCTPDKASTTALPLTPPPVALAPTEFSPELYGGGGRAGVLAEVQKFLLLPFGTPVPADSSRVVVRFHVDGIGLVSKQRIVQGLSPVVDSAVLEAVNQLHFRSADRFYQPGEGLYTLSVPAPGADSPAQRREATTRWLRTAHRLPGEADSTFVRRVLPVSYADAESPGLQALAWRPNPYGRQLVFTCARIEPNALPGWLATDVFVLDPFRPRTYAVQRLHIDNIGDLSGQSAAPFVADVNGDRHPDLVTLIAYSRSVEDGHLYDYRVQVWRTAGLDLEGRPRYREDETAYPYLEYHDGETPGPYPRQPLTPVTVRQALTQHQRQLAARTTKMNK